MYKEYFIRVVRIVKGVRDMVFNYPEYYLMETVEKEEDRKELYVIENEADLAPMNQTSLKDKTK